MPIFHYTALNSEGKAVSSQSFAVDEAALRTRLAARGLRLISARMIQKSSASNLPSRSVVVGIGVVCLIGMGGFGIYQYKNTPAISSETDRENITHETANQIIPDQVTPIEGSDFSNASSTNHSGAVDFRFRSQATQHHNVFYIPFKAAVILDNGQVKAVARTQFKAWPAPSLLPTAKNLMSLQSNGERSYYTFTTDEHGQALIRLMTGLWYFSAEYIVPGTRSRIIWGKKEAESNSLTNVYGLQTKIYLTHTEADEVQGDPLNLVH